VHASGIVTMLSIPLLFPGAPPRFFLIRSLVGNGVPPSPLVFWNHKVRAGLCAKSFRTKDLYAKYSGIRS
jgi:hypothetical protein